MKKILSIGVFLCVCFSALAAGEELAVQPSHEFELDIDSVREALAQAPLDERLELGAGDVTLTLPMPDGVDERFRVAESPMLTPQDAQRYPHFRSYRIRGLDHPTWNGRLSLTHRGLGGLIRTDQGAVQISRRPVASSRAYASTLLPPGPAECSVGAPTRPSVPLGPSGVAEPGQTEGGGVCWDSPEFPPPSQMTVQTYVAAFGARADYTANVIGDEDDVLAQVFADVSELNGILEPELSIRLLPIMDHDLVFDSAFPVGSACETIAPDCVEIGSGLLEDIACVFAKLRDDVLISDYDLAHLLGDVSYGCRSAAIIGSVCLETRPDHPDVPEGIKGGALTAIRNPKTLAHEMGHQLGAYHTYSYKNQIPNTGCQNVSVFSAMEPGSGSTLMSYAGSCDAGQNIENQRDEYYHIDSIEWMQKTTLQNCAPCPTTEYCEPQGPFQCLAGDTFRTSCFYEDPPPGGPDQLACDPGETIFISTCDCSGSPSGESWYCGPSSGLTNDAPTLWGGGEFSIPPSTAFLLSASAADPNNDPMTYNWEQYNNTCMSTSALVDDTGPDPLFRSRPPLAAAPYANLVRFFTENDPPVAGYILPDHPTVNESEPLQLRLVVRDGEGGVSEAQTDIEVVGAAFEVVVDPAPPGDPVRVHWNYVNADATVEVLLSQAGGLPTTVAGPWLPNSGEAFVNLPPGCGSDDNEMIVVVKQVEPLAMVAKVTFSGRVTFSIPCECPDEFACTGQRCEASRECTTTTTSLASCFDESDELLTCPVPWIVENCPCLGGACDVSESQEFYCNCPPPMLGSGCDDGVFCNGEEACDGELGCVAGAAPCQDPGDSPCNEIVDLCIENCPQGQFCTGGPTGTCNPTPVGVDGCAKGTTVYQCDSGETLYRQDCDCNGQNSGFGAKSFFCAP